MFYCIMSIIAKSCRQAQARIIIPLAKVWRIKVIINAESQLVKVLEREREREREREKEREKKKTIFLFEKFLCKSIIYQAELSKYNYQ